MKELDTRTDPSTCTELKAEGTYTLCRIWDLIKLEAKKVSTQTEALRSWTPYRLGNQCEGNVFWKEMLMTRADLNERW